MKQESFVFNHIDSELEKEICILVQHRVLDETFNITERHNQEIERLTNQIQIQNRIIKQFNQRIKSLENPI